MPKTFSLYLALSKPRIGLMVAITSALGYFLAIASFEPYGKFLIMMLGTVMSCSGAAALNNFLERDVDKKMDRTKKRALPTGELSPVAVLSYGTVLVFFGCTLLAWLVNPLTGFLALLSAFLYVLVYTPLKRVTWLNTSIGTVPGALPPMGGWAAATGELGIGAWVLFAIMFLWQHPHFYAIAWIYRDDYRRGGLQMLPTVDQEGRKTIRHILIFTSLLVPISVLPATFGIAGKLYFYGALLSGGAFLAASILFSLLRTDREARNLLNASLLYLPFVLLLVVADARLF